MDQVPHDWTRLMASLRGVPATIVWGPWVSDPGEQEAFRQWLDRFRADCARRVAAGLPGIELRLEPWPGETSRPQLPE